MRTPESPRRRSIVLATATLPLAWAAPSVRAQPAKVPREGAEYALVRPPQPTEAPGKIEVVDFFWYGCPHCYELLPLLLKWEKTLPADVALRHVPVSFSPDREPHSRIYYALEALGQADAMRTKVFDAINRDRNRLLDENVIADFMAKNGIDRAKWLAAYKSFGVDSRTKQALRVVEAYRVDGTPSFAVAGRFMTSPSQAGSREGVFTTLDYLIAQVRTGH